MEELKKATAEDISHNYSLYRSMIRVMKSVDGFEPIGACCGRNKDIHIQDFIANRIKYIDKMEKITTRTIIPKFKGLAYNSKAARHYNSETITDEEILDAVKNGYLTEDMFDWTNYKGKIDEEKEVKQTKKKVIKAR